ncbi:tripartite tricarboxylate transporter substrate binding protein [Roseomonas sp. HJA6]|uniref:Tripartite tricarboxylate transporter substrate binding protein n=1 Tax=Roseomonas alba TaxID=2846776 RepID=A0ABS7AF61_9PROT|nr:tripartite tricarboxylate transporter substrate binding protein [Neoroseomonas alba]MBW6399799.1 tripartite tricarboxylate transporter substrate binding protein [Neoroseomonas alba]
MPILTGRRALAAGVASLLAAPRLVRAQSVTRDVRLIVPYAPGGTVDILGRLLAEVLPPTLGHNVVVENRSGAGAYIGLQTVANAPVDGHTIGLAPDLGLAVSPVIPGATLPIDPDRTLTPVASLIRVPTLLVARNNAPFTTFAEFIAYARANPGKVTVGVSGTGTITHLLIARLAALTGISVEHVPYRGGTPALLDVMAGNVDLYFSLITESMPHVEGGKMRPLAVASPTRNAALPDIPALTETWPGFTGTADYGLIVASGLSPDWVAFWNRTVTDALARPDVQARLQRLRADPTGGSPADYATKLRTEREVWGEVVRQAGIRV